jgi:protein gp37
MSDKSAIEWTDATWNPIVGCSATSPACTNCYAMAMARRIIAMAETSGKRTHYQGTAIYHEPSRTPIWTGKVAQAPEDILTQPLHWKRGRKIFVNSMGDLFHPSVPDEWIDRVFAVAARCPQHTLQILTKRGDRMRRYCSDPATPMRIFGAASELPDAGTLDMKAVSDLHQRLKAWPLANCWLGATAEDQPRADERRDDLAALADQGWTTFASYEPALGPVDWRGWEFLRQLIAGGESGPRARVPHPDWFRTARDWSASNGVAYYFKQWGEWAEVDCPDANDDGSNQDAYFDALDAAFKGDPKYAAMSPDGYRFDGSERVNSRPHGPSAFYRVGKRRAGRMLDGREHQESPA